MNKSESGPLEVVGGPLAHAERELSKSVRKLPAIEACFCPSWGVPLPRGGGAGTAESDLTSDFFFFLPLPVFFLEI